MMKFKIKDKYNVLKTYWRLKVIKLIEKYFNNKSELNVMMFKIGDL